MPYFAPVLFIINATCIHYTHLFRTTLNVLQSFLTCSKTYLNRLGRNCIFEAEQLFIYHNTFYSIPLRLIFSSEIVGFLETKPQLFISMKMTPQEDNYLGG